MSIFTDIYINSSIGFNRSPGFGGQHMDLTTIGNKSYR